MQYSWVENDALQKNVLLALRRCCLRQPLGLDFTPEELAREAADWQLAAHEGGRVIGGLILTRLSVETVKLRQMVVAPEARGRGIGRALLHRAEARAREEGFQEITLHARQTAEAFYRRCGYLPLGDIFMEVTLPHRAMMRSLR